MIKYWAVLVIWSTGHWGLVSGDTMKECNESSAELALYYSTTEYKVPFEECQKISRAKFGKLHEAYMVEKRSVHFVGDKPEWEIVGGYRCWKKRKRKLRCRNYGSK